MKSDTFTNKRMNTLHKSLTIIFLAVSIFILGVGVDFVSAQNTAAGTAASRPLLDPLLSRYLRFGRLTTKDGLSSDQTRNVVQDKRGFMWFGTLGGLDRYDGASVKTYRRDPDDPQSLSHDVARALLVDQSGDLWIGIWGGGLNQYDREKDAFIRYQYDPDNPHSLSHNTVRMVYEDRAGTIWTGTMGGLNKLNRDSRQFTRYQHDPDDPNSLSNNIVWSILEDSTGVLWVGTGDGLNRFDPKTEQFVHYRHDPDDPGSLNHNTVRSIYEDRSGNLWLGTDRGLGKLSPERTRITRYQHDANDPETLSHNIVNSVCEDGSGRLWVGTYGGGLNRFDRETATFTHYRHNATDPYSLISDTIWQVYKDQQGMLWIATEGGIGFLDGGAKPFYHYRNIPSNPTSLSDKTVWALYAGRAGIVWVGSSSGGLNKFDPQTETFTQYLNSPSDPIDLSNETVTAIHEDRQGLVWIGTRAMGLIKFDPDTERTAIYSYDDTNPHSLGHDSVIYIYEDRTGTLWIGTYGGGLNALDRETEQFTRYQHDPAGPHTLSNNFVASIFEDRAGVLWVATNGGGLNKFNRQTEKFTHYLHDPSDPNSLCDNAALSMYEDRTGTFWIGTSKGIEKFDRRNDQFSHYTTKNGLPDNSIWGILEDEQGRLWLSTANGLSRFDPRTENFRNYTVSDGLQSNTFSLYSAHSKSRSGEMFFGGLHGFNAFYPDQIVDNLTPPPVVITAFQLANQPVPIGGDSVLQKSILETDELVLSYQDSVLSFEFAALDFRAPAENRYKYKMAGFESEWTEVDSSRRFATYTNLDPGEYIFRVIAANNDGVWNEEGASIKVTITPPWWETLWFRIVLGLLVIGLLIGGYLLRVRTLHSRSRKLEILVEDRTIELQKAKEDAEEANKAKSIFLANMSHELRTPLHAILGFARVMTRDSELDRENQERLDIINRSGEHLLDMIDDILHLSKIEAGRVELKNEVIELTKIVQDVAQMMKSPAEGKGLSFNLELDPEIPPYVLGDDGKLRQVLINLLGNAVKFTETGAVWLHVRSQPKADDPDRVMLQFEVQDTGPGIPQDKKDEAFEAFIQISHSQKTKGGTGLGLAITKTLVEIMNGEILLDSEPGQGTMVKVSIPCHLSDAVTAPPINEPAIDVVGLQADQPEWRILVVDDNPENRMLLTTLLTNIGCHVKEAQNGEEAIAIFEEWNPHFIWMDIRMPVLDGFEATRIIRTLPGGGAVRIVAVTASVLEERHEEILACGCDEVVRKPYKDQEIFDSMARQLGVKYIYKERGAEALRKPGINLTTEILAELPPDLLQDLRDTTLVLNIEDALEVIARIAENAPEVAAGLKELVDSYRMVELRDLLGEAD